MRLSLERAMSSNTLTIVYRGLPRIDLHLRSVRRFLHRRVLNYSLVLVS